MNMAVEIGENQLLLLRSAAQREDRLLAFPEGRPTAADRRAARALLQAGWAREVHARGEAPVWRRDKETESAFALKLTAAGAKAIASVDCGEIGSKRKPSDEAETESRKADHRSARDGKNSEDQLPASAAAPRSGSKIDAVLKLLDRPQGATLKAMLEATGWLPHTTRAALTGLRKRGYALERLRNEQDRACIYRLQRPLSTGA
jgi:DNA-binding MarR family transcriptional regulator